MFLAEIFGYLLNFLYDLLHSYGISIIIFSIIVRIILIPITINQQKSMKKTNKIQKEIKIIQNKYKNNPEKLNQETMELYKREKMNPLSGCFSAIIQIFIILSVFWLVSSPLTYMKKVKELDIYKEYEAKVAENSSTKSSYKEIAMINLVEKDYIQISEQLKNENIENKEELENKRNELNKLRINMNFCGIDLSKVPTQNLNDFKVYIIPILYVLSSFISIRLTTNSQSNENNTNKENENSTEIDAMQSMNKSMSYMMPIMSVSIAAVAPLGLALYWLISNILMIIERLIIKKIFDSKGEEKND